MTRGTAKAQARISWVSSWCSWLLQIPIEPPDRPFPAVSCVRPALHRVVLVHVLDQLGDLAQSAQADEQLFRVPDRHSGIECAVYDEQGRLHAIEIEEGRVLDVLGTPFPGRAG